MSIPTSEQTVLCVTVVWEENLSVNSQPRARLWHMIVVVTSAGHKSERGVAPLVQRSRVLASIEITIQINVLPS